MIQLLIIADDFTGALDTSVQLAEYGAKTLVVTDAHIDLREVPPETEVLVIDAETRHLPATAAYETVYDIVMQAVKQQIPHIYKKTDSALRGNIGAELQALMDAANEASLAFLPAFPQIGRNTVDGIHYINSVPVAQSVFGREPFNPVRYSEVSALIGTQSSVATYTVTAEDSAMQGKGIFIFDASSLSELESIGGELMRRNCLRIAAGCAGFGMVLPTLLGWKEKKGKLLPPMDSRLLVVCGSVNPITVEQVDYAEKNGFMRHRLTPVQKLDRSYWQQGEGHALIKQLRSAMACTPYMIIDSNDLGDNLATATYAQILGMTTEDVRVSISQSIGQIVSQLYDSPALGTLMITGGDTLLQCMNQMGVHTMEPLCELATGVVLSRFNKHGCIRHVISKSGGFGSHDLIVHLLLLIEETSNRS